RVGRPVHREQAPAAGSHCWDRCQHRCTRNSQLRLEGTGKCPRLLPLPPAGTIQRFLPSPSVPAQPLVCHLSLPGFLLPFRKRGSGRGGCGPGRTGFSCFSLCCSGISGQGALLLIKVPLSSISSANRSYWAPRSPGSCSR
ncbi:hypothetical protein DV515_00014162, partial [Chloebia gouldiae]